MLERFMQWLGFGLCHQLPERSFVAGGLQLPVCARDTGIYIGFVVSLLVIAALHRGERPTGFPGRITWVVMGLLVGSMAWDGVTSYAGLRSTTNDLRLLTGLAAGFAMAVIVVPILNGELWAAASSARVLSPATRLAGWALFVPVTFFALKWLGPLLGAGYALLTAAAIVATLSAVNMVIVAMLPFFDRRATRPLDLLAPYAVALLLSAVEIAAAGTLRQVLLGLVS